MATQEQWAERIINVTLIADILDQVASEVGTREAVWVAQFVAAYLAVGEDMSEEAAADQGKRMRAAVRTGLARYFEHDFEDLITEVRLEDPEV